VCRVATELRRSAPAISQSRRRCPAQTHGDHAGGGPDHTRPSEVRHDGRRDRCSSRPPTSIETPARGQAPCSWSRRSAVGWLAGQPYDSKWMTSTEGAGGGIISGFGCAEFRRSGGTQSVGATPPAGRRAREEEARASECGSVTGAWLPAARLGTAVRLNAGLWLLGYPVVRLDPKSAPAPGG